LTQDVDKGLRDRPPLSLRNEASPASAEMIDAAMSVPMWNHMNFIDSWARATKEDVAEMLGQMFYAMRLVRST